MRDHLWRQFMELARFHAEVCTGAMLTEVMICNIETAIRDLEAEDA